MTSVIVRSIFIIHPGDHSRCVDEARRHREGAELDIAAEEGEGARQGRSRRGLVDSVGRDETELLCPPFREPQIVIFICWCGRILHNQEI